MYFQSLFCSAKCGVNLFLTSRVNKNDLWELWLSHENKWLAGHSHGSAIINDHPRGFPALKNFRNLLSRNSASSDVKAAKARCRSADSIKLNVCRLHYNLQQSDKMWAGFITTYSSLTKLWIKTVKIERGPEF